jgi:hypothetical protein
VVINVSYNPNVYILGGKTEVRIDVTAIDGTKMIPIESRLSIKEPSGMIVTYSGGDPELVQASGYLYTLYRPPTIGWYQYEAWALDASGREDVATRGFEVVDSVY